MGKLNSRITGKKMEKIKPVLNDAFLKTFEEKQKYMKKNMGKVNFNITGKNRINNKHKDSKAMGSLDIWGEKDLHINPKVWDS